ncbi:hypothetical protein SAMN02787144_1019142 [Streptomyces atratus]|jgi:hypothetical protein|uniref:Uncharacterized protein n=1 Tax=Streptomyces atratus TaxID=1893 RepID=A0A1K2EHV5_STRAR|nr:hypothetical protein SAMN02787144_1019142 [Streptomyces atratus]
MAPGDESGGAAQERRVCHGVHKSYTFAGPDASDPANGRFAQVRNVAQAPGATAKVGPSGTLESRTWAGVATTGAPCEVPTTVPGRFVHALLLLNAASALLG